MQNELILPAEVWHCKRSLAFFAKAISLSSLINKSNLPSRLEHIESMHARDTNILGFESPNYCDNLKMPRDKNSLTSTSRPCHNKNSSYLLISNNYLCCTALNVGKGISNISKLPWEESYFNSVEVSIWICHSLKLNFITSRNFKEIDSFINAPKVSQQEPTNVEYINHP